MAKRGEIQHKTPLFVSVTGEKRAGTHLQRKAAERVVEAIRTNREVSTGQILREVGFSKNTSLRPAIVTRSQGFLAELARLGLTEDLVTSALVDDIKAKPGKRAFELSIAGKWLGLDRRVPSDNPQVGVQNAVIIINPPKE